MASAEQNDRGEQTFVNHFREVGRVRGFQKFILHVGFFFGEDLFPYINIESSDA